MGSRCLVFFLAHKARNRNPSGHYVPTSGISGLAAGLGESAGTVRNGTGTCYALRAPANFRLKAKELGEADVRSLPKIENKAQFLQSVHEVPKCPWMTCIGDRARSLHRSPDFRSSESSRRLLLIPSLSISFSRLLLVMPKKAACR